MPRRAKKDVARFEFDRARDGQYLKLTIDPSIEEVFKSDDVNTSTKYVDEDGDGLNYYGLKSELKTLAKKYESYREEGRPVELTEYGTQLIMENGAVNLSILRTVDASEGIKVRVDDLILDRDVDEWAMALAGFLKFVYHQYLNRASIKVQVQVEDQE